MDLREALENETVADIGYRNPVVVQENEPLGAAIDRMRKYKVGCVLVLNGGRLTGIFTERDLITRVLGKDDILDEPIAEFMTSRPILSHSYEPIHLVLARMYAEGIRHMPVLDAKDRPVGTISVESVVHFLAEYHPTTVYNLPPDPGLFTSTRDGG
jgi:CBS domain-containing protein